MSDQFRRFLSGIDRLFLWVVIVPTLLSVLYFGLLASDVYISESRFVVRSPDKQNTVGLGALIKGTNVASGGDEIYAADDFIMSRDALRAINRNNAFAEAYSSRDISMFDRFSPFGGSADFEDLYRYFNHKVRVDYETSTAITRLTVRAYTAEDAHRFNEELLEQAEGTVNRMNQRARDDLIHFTTTEVDGAKLAAQQAAVALAAYRNHSGVVDPEKQAAVQLQMISKLQDELIADRSHLAELQKVAPDNSQIEVLQARIGSLSGQIGDEEGKVAGDKGSLAATGAEYQHLVVESEVADKQLGVAMASREQAENEARRQQAYVERVVQPNQPDHAIEPRRFSGIAATLLLALIAWGVLKMLLAGIREHVG